MIITFGPLAEGGYALRAAGALEFHILEVLIFLNDAFKVDFGVLEVVADVAQFVLLHTCQGSALGLMV